MFKLLLFCLLVAFAAANPAPQPGPQPAPAPAPRPGYYASSYGYIAPAVAYNPYAPLTYTWPSAGYIL